jgi:putative hemin transport protein
MPMTALLERYQELAREGGRMLRARDAALRLDTTEAALVACGALGPVRSMRPGWAALIGALPRAGRVMALTRNEYAVHERHGTYIDVSSGPGHILVLGPDIDLRLFPGNWANAYALGGERPSIQIFDNEGVAVHKVYATAATDRAGWDGIVEEFATPAAVAPPTVPAAARAPAAEKPVDAAALRTDWLGLQDTHDFIRLLRQHGASRRQAFRLAGPDLALALNPAAGGDTMRLAAVAEVPIMVFVGNRGGIQIHTGPISRLHDIPGWFNVLDPDFNLHLREAGIATAWRVVKPTVDGPVTSIELLDAAGEAVATLFGARKPGQPEREEWRKIANTIAERHALGTVEAAA